MAVRISVYVRYFDHHNFDCPAVCLPPLINYATMHTGKRKWGGEKSGLKNMACPDTQTFCFCFFCTASPEWLRTCVCVCDVCDVCACVRLKACDPEFHMYGTTHPWINMCGTMHPWINMYGTMNIWAHMDGTTHIWIHIYGTINPWTHICGTTHPWIHMYGTMHPWAHTDPAPAGPSPAVQSAERPPLTRITPHSNHLSLTHPTLTLISSWLCRLLS